jgi:hypothetical protein
VLPLWQLCKVILSLCKLEPGENFLDETYKQSRLEEVRKCPYKENRCTTITVLIVCPPTQIYNGWVLPMNWFNEETLPTKGA